MDYTNSFFRSLLLGTLFLIQIKYGITGSKDENDLILSLSQKKTLDRFKEIMSPVLEHEYMKKDVFLIRWLRAKDFDINDASFMLKESLQWRKEENIDNIENEDWSYFEHEYPIFTDVYDKDGRPTTVANMGTFDIRKAAISGNGEKLMRWMIKVFENLERQVRDLQGQGKNITRWNMLFNLDRFSATSLCFQCLPLYTKMAKILELDYPNGSSKLWFINSPSAFSVVLNIVRPILSPGTAAAVKAFETNRAEWESVILQQYDKNQLPYTFGGRRTDHQID